MFKSKKSVKKIKGRKIKSDKISKQYDVERKSMYLPRDPQGRPGPEGFVWSEISQRFVRYPRGKYKRY